MLKLRIAGRAGKKDQQAGIAQAPRWYAPRYVRHLGFIEGTDYDHKHSTNSKFQGHMQGLMRG